MQQGLVGDYMIYNIDRIVSKIAKDNNLEYFISDHTENSIVIGLSKMVNGAKIGDNFILTWADLEDDVNLIENYCNMMIRDMKEYWN